jgi:hypothetical protein
LIHEFPSEGLGRLPESCYFRAQDTISPQDLPSDFSSKSQLIAKAGAPPHFSVFAFKAALSL